MLLRTSASRVGLASALHRPPSILPWASRALVTSSVSHKVAASSKCTPAPVLNATLATKTLASCIAPVTCLSPSYVPQRSFWNVKGGEAYKSTWQKSVTNPEIFWDNAKHALRWMRPYDKVNLLRSQVSDVIIAYPLSVSFCAAIIPITRNLTLQTPVLLPGSHLCLALSLVCSLAPSLHFPGEPLRHEGRAHRVVSWWPSQRNGQLS